MRSSSLRVSLLGMLAASTAFSVVPLPQAVSASTPVCYVFQINITGTATSSSGSKNFAIKEYAVFRNVGVRSNPVDFWIIPAQDPNSSSALGQLRFMSNSAFAPNAGIASQKLDLAKGVNGNGFIQFSLISDNSFFLTNPNVFTTPGINSAFGGLGGLSLPYLVSIGGGDITQSLNGSGILNIYYLVPRQGQVNIAFQNNQLNGTLNIVGSQVDNTNNAGQYQAQFSGPLINYFSCA